MPLYDFECPECGKVKEVIQHFDQTPPVCDCGVGMERKISICNHTFGFRLTESSYVKGNKMDLERNV